MNKKFFRLEIGVCTICLGMALIVLAGCEGKSKVSTATSTEGLFNETGFPIVNQPYTLKAISSKHEKTQDFNSLQLFQELEKKTGVHIEWEYTPQGSDWNTQKPLVLASGQLPDIFFARTTLVESDVLSNLGLFVPLDPLIEKYGENLKRIFAADPSIKSFVTAYDGHIYGLPQKMPRRPRAYSLNGINQAWLDKLGLEMPTTTDEFYNVLKAFKTRDPNGNGIADEIPWSFQAFNDLAGCTDFFGAFGIAESLGETWLSVTNGKVQYIAAQDGFQDAIAWLNKLYAEQLIDQEAFTMDWGMWAAKCDPPAGTPDIVGVAPHWSRDLAFGLTRYEHYSLLMPLKGPKGYQYWRHNNEFVQSAKYTLEITTSTQHPEIALRWADALYDELVSLQMYYGAVGEVLEVKDDGSFFVKLPPEGLDNDTWRWGRQMNDFSPCYVSDARSAMGEDPLFDAQVIDKALFTPYFAKEYYPPAALTPDEAGELAILRTDIHNYAREQASLWVVNGGVEREYAAFVQQLNTMGLPRMVEIYQNAYNRYMGK
ncbi:MAG: extracellular solute-binding protein [Treponema sp.]|nr:extracellular solute-binding protein [Treponema sp.]